MQGPVTQRSLFVSGGVFLSNSNLYEACSNLKLVRTSYFGSLISHFIFLELKSVMPLCNFSNFQGCRPCLIGDMKNHFFMVASQGTSVWMRAGETNI